MRKKIIIFSLLAVFLMLMMPVHSAFSSIKNLQFNKANEELLNDIDKDELLEKLKINPFEMIKKVKRGELNCTELFMEWVAIWTVTVVTFGLMLPFTFLLLVAIWFKALELKCEWIFLF